MAHDIARDFVHLAQDGAAAVLPPFTGDPAWFADFGGAAEAGASGWLVSSYDFSESWSSWEMHPAGAELVLCLSGSIDLIREVADGGTERIRLEAGAHSVNPPGSWHTADVSGPARVLFVTWGEGTQTRPR
jgi:uncharacterized cupin superfamily protein